MNRYFLCLFFLFFWSCQLSSFKDVKIAFYYWRSSYRLDSLEIAYLQRLDAQKIYLRVFDVDWNEFEKRAVPLDELNLNNSRLPSFEQIPTIFITNRTMINLPSEQVEKLGDQIIGKIKLKWKVFNWPPPEEVQLDCDWSAQSRLKYFKLIDYLRKKYQLKVSATIRLHQFKYPDKTGVPPADCGVLMVYNMGDLSDPGEKNSILNLKAASQYLNHAQKYPLRLSVALPLFSWGVLWRRSKVIALIPEISKENFRVHTRTPDDTQVEITKSHYFGELYLYKGDRIRFEEVTIKDLKETAHLVRNNLRQDSLELCFYHLSGNVLEKYSVKDLEEIRDILRN